ncbi:MAG: hypothetical protein ACRDJ5_07600 [Actinomycetota bacterium]
MAEEPTYRFTITGTVTAPSRQTAWDRIHVALRTFGFSDVGDGTLWLNRPRDRDDIEGRLLGAAMISVLDLTVDTEESKDR